MNIKLFPVLDDNNIMVPYGLVMKHQKQAFENHMQNVDRLAERGGLSMEELYYVLSDKPFGFKTGLTPSSIESWLCDVINEYNKELVSKVDESDKLGLRPCIVTINDKRPGTVMDVNAWFHRWGDGYKFVFKDPNYISKGREKTNCVIAIVEFEDGTIHEITDPERIRFTDR